VAVMYCGQVVEVAPVDYIFKPVTEFNHPYTEALLKSIPLLSGNISDRLEVIPGAVPHPLEIPKGCRFAPRCKFRTTQCEESMPGLDAVSESQYVRCLYPRKGVRSDG